MEATPWTIQTAFNEALNWMIASRQATPLTIQKAFDKALNLMKERDKQHRERSKSVSNSRMTKPLKTYETPSTIQESFQELLCARVEFTNIKYRPPKTILSSLTSVISIFSTCPHLRQLASDLYN